MESAGAGGVAWTTPVALMVPGGAGPDSEQPVILGH